MQLDREDMDARRSEPFGLPQTEQKHPDEYEEDLNPDRLAGQNIGGSERGLVSAHDLKDVHRALSDFGDDELGQIPIVPEGERLQQGATYLDLNDRQRGEFTATGEMSAGASDRIVPKDEVPYTLWNRLRGIDDPRRTQ